MAVLNKIRQRSLFLILIIALALFSFVLADLFKNSDALTAKSQNIVATINGKDISREDFLQKVEAAIKDVGTENSFSYIFDLSMGGFVYVDESLDVTTLVKAKLGL